MISCNGLGECLHQCSHKKHNGYCPSKCCSPIECINFKFCKVKNPKQILMIHNGKCVNCDIQFGRHKITDIIEECTVCLDNKNIIILKCNHHICNECWFKITEKGFRDDDDEIYKPLCPLCRNINDWSK